MSAVQILCRLALHPLLDGACKTVGFSVSDSTSGTVTTFLLKHFTDHSQKLERALRIANERAWKALEIALAGDSFWGRWRNLLGPADQTAFAHQIQTFLKGNALHELEGASPGFRQDCLRELRAAEKAGQLKLENLAPSEVAQQVGSFARFGSPQERLAGEMQLVTQIADFLRERGYPQLGRLLDLQVHQGASLLVIAVRFFFRGEVEDDQQLWQGLMWASWQSLVETQQKGFACLNAAFIQNGQRLQELLADIHIDIIDIRDKVTDQLARHRLEGRELRPQDSFAIHSPAEREEVKRLLTIYRQLSLEQQEKLPALLLDLGKLQHAAGDLATAQQIFNEVTRVTRDAGAKAEAFYSAYLAALERRQWDEALAPLKQAAALDPERFQPFRLDRYDPQRILGAGGFGVAFLCRHQLTGGFRVIKSLRLDGVGKNVGEQVIREAKAMEEVRHEAIITLHDCEYADSKKTRLYLAMEYFDGLPLTEHVKKYGCLEHRDLITLARMMAEGLQEAHERGILHRDIKPANVLVKRDDEGWRVKIIDFGLALKESVNQATIATPAPQSRLTSNYEFAGTIDYAAPEQIGRLPGASVGRAADVYGFGKTCCYALFQTPHPLGRHWRSIPPKLSKWLDGCLEEDPSARTQTFADALQGLSSIRIITSREKSKPQPALTLVVVRGVKPNAEYPVQEGENVIGREDADFDLSGQESADRRYISQNHCSVFLEKGTLFLQDNTSTNGTYLNRRRLDPGERCQLSLNDQIQLGAVVILVRG